MSQAVGLFCNKQVREERSWHADRALRDHENSSCHYFNPLVGATMSADALTRIRADQYRMYANENNDFRPAIPSWFTPTLLAPISRLRGTQRWPIVVNFLVVRLPRS